MQYAYIYRFCRKTTILAQIKSYKLLKISILCNLIKVLQLLYLRHLSTLTVKAPDIRVKMFHGLSVLIVNTSQKCYIFTNNKIIFTKMCAYICVFQLFFVPLCQISKL